MENATRFWLLLPRDVFSKSTLDSVGYLREPRLSIKKSRATNRFLMPFYESSLSYWGDLSRQYSTEGVVTLVDRKGSLIAQLPLQFAVSGSGNSALGSWLALVAFSLLDGISDSLPSITYRNSVVAQNDVIHSGVYEVQVFLGSEVSSAPGPHAKTTRQKPLTQSDSDTVSHSSRSSAEGQSPWRLKLFQRDTVCLISRSFMFLEACHIVPFSLGDAFVSTISKGRCSLYSPANGLSLEPRLHKLFDAYRLGIYCFESRLYVHCFAVPVLFQKYHGCEIKFHKEVVEQAPTWLPNTDCLRWHYAQCILTSFRGTYVPFPALQPMTWG